MKRKRKMSIRQMWVFIAKTYENASPHLPGRPQVEFSSDEGGVEVNGICQLVRMAFGRHLISLENMGKITNVSSAAADKSPYFPWMTSNDHNGSKVRAAFARKQIANIDRKRKAAK